MSVEKVKYLIVGGGVTGLCAALALGRGAVVLEQNDEPGGFCRSFRQDGFLWDCAGHFFHFRSEEGRRFFLSLFAPEELTERQKRCQILYRGRLIDYPFQANIHQLEKAELIDCLYDLFHRPEHRQPESFLDLLYGSYGRAVTEKFLRPYNEKLYACPLRELEADAMGRFFPAVSLADIIDNMKTPRDSSYNRRFFYPKNGAGALVEKLCARLAPGALRLGRRLCVLDRERRLAADSRGDTYRYEYLISTAPLPSFLELLGDEASLALKETLSWNQVLVFNLGFEKKAPLREQHWLYIPDRELPFYRVGYYDNISGAPRASLYVELGFPRDAVIDAERQLDLSLAALRAAGLIQPDNRLVAHQALLMNPAYVHLRAETQAKLRAALAALAEERIYGIGRYGAWRYSSIEDNMLEALALAGRLKEAEKR